MIARPAVPAKLARELKVEAGHRCAIPTCRQVPVELAHIVPWSECLEHTFENMIALCPTCHTRYDNGDIDRPSMLIYKRNLSLLHGRYNEAERRLLAMFAAGNVEDYEVHDGRIIRGAVMIESNRDFDFHYLLKDGLLVHEEMDGIMIGDVPIGPQLYCLTDDGAAFVERIATGQNVDAEPTV